MDAGPNGFANTERCRVVPATRDIPISGEIRMTQLHVLDQRATYKQDVVDLLKQWLARAEAGEVMSISIIADINADEFEIDSSKIEDLAHRLGKLRLLERQLIDQAVG